MTPTRGRSAGPSETGRHTPFRALVCPDIADNKLDAMTAPRLHATGQR